MGERLLWAVKNGDLTAAKEVVEKVWSRHPHGSTPDEFVQLLDSFDIRLTLPLDKEKLTVFHNSNSSHSLQSYPNWCHPIIIYVPLCTSIKRTSISTILMFASGLGDPV